MESAMQLSSAHPELVEGQIIHSLPAQTPAIWPLSAPREEIAAHLAAGLHLLPRHMHGGVQRYVLHGVEPGQFLRALLENNLFKAVAMADDDNLDALAAWCHFLENRVPSACHGSREKVRDWLAMFAKAQAALDVHSAEAA
jgi:hypothetical protein